MKVETGSPLPSNDVRRREKEKSSRCLKINDEMVSSCSLRYRCLSDSLPLELNFSHAVYPGEKVQFSSSCSLFLHFFFPPSLPFTFTLLRTKLTILSDDLQFPSEMDFRQRISHKDSRLMCVSLYISSC